MTARIENVPVSPPLNIDHANKRVGINNTVANTNSKLKVIGDSSNEYAMDVYSATAITASVESMIRFKQDASGHSKPAVLIADNGTGHILQLDTTKSGLLLPRLTTAQKNAMTTPTAGHLIYDTNLGKLCVYTGAAWEAVTSA